MTIRSWDQFRIGMISGISFLTQSATSIQSKGASPASIKALMRRAAQFQLEMAPDGKLQQAAIEEMVFSGGTLQWKFLGGSSTGLESAGKSDH